MVRPRRKRLNPDVCRQTRQFLFTGCLVCIFTCTPKAMFSQSITLAGAFPMFEKLRERKRRELPPQKDYVLALHAYTANITEWGSALWC